MAWLEFLLMLYPKALIIHVSDLSFASRLQNTLKVRYRPCFTVYQAKSSKVRISQVRGPIPTFSNDVTKPLFFFQSKTDWDGIYDVRIE